MSSLRFSGVVILAAGEASRMGAPKQLLPWKNSTLLEQACDKAKSLSDTVVVVLGAHANVILKDLTLSVPYIINDKWMQGMSTSISMGVDYLTKKQELQNILILLADQPLLESTYLEKLILNCDVDKICVTKYSGSVGVPAVFYKKYFTALVGLTGRVGAKKLIGTYQKNLIKITPENEQLVDIDDRETYEKLYAKFGKPN